MYKIIILDNQHTPLTLENKGPNRSIASYFVICVHFAIDLLNGGTTFFNLANTELPSTPMAPNTVLNQSSAHIVFLQGLQLIPYFKEMTYAGNPNHKCYQQLMELSSLPYDKTVSRKFFEIIQTLQVPGISSIKIYNTLSKNQQFIDELDIPIDQIPERFLCSVNTAVMDTPCYDKRNPDVKYEYSNLIKQTKNPHTTLPLTKEDIVPDEDLKGEIDVYIKTLKMLQKYKISPLEISQKNLELALRRAGAAGHQEDLTLLLNEHHVHINAQGGQKERTALHWVVIASTKYPAKKEQYKECIHTLVAAGADCHIQDKEKNHLLNTQLSKRYYRY